MPIFVIYVEYPSSNVREDREVLTLFSGTHQQADKFVDSLNNAEDDNPRTGRISGRRKFSRGYDVQLTTPENASEWIG